MESGHYGAWSIVFLVMSVTLVSVLQTASSSASSSSIRPVEKAPLVARNVFTRQMHTAGLNRPEEGAKVVGFAYNAPSSSDELMRRLLLQRRQQHQLQLQQLLVPMAATGGHNDVYEARGEPTAEDVDDQNVVSDEDEKKKRGDARRCFYHAINCW